MRPFPRSKGLGQRHVLLVAGLLSACLAAQAQDAPPRGLSLSSSVAADLSLVTDRRPVLGESHDTVLGLRPAFRVDSRAGRLQGSLSYAVNFSHHSKVSDDQRVQNFLSSNFQLEAVERWMYVDGSSSVTQQSASVYGEQSVGDSATGNRNRIEVGTVSLSPYVRGAFGPAVSYEVRLTGAATNGRRSIAADSSSTGASVSLSSALPGTLIGWSLLANTQTNDFRAGRKTQNDRYSARLSLTPDPDLTVNLRGGQESNDVGNLVKTTYDNWGAGLSWRPSPRTRAQIDFDDRYFGRSHQLLLELRQTSSSVQFTSSRDAANGADPNGTGQRVTLYQLLDRVLASAYPDPTERDLQIRAILQGANNADPNQLISTGSINSAVTLFERHQLSFVYNGARISGTMQVFSSRTRVIDAAASAAARAPEQQWGYMTLATYRLSPTASVSLNGTRTLTQGTDLRAGNELKSLSLGWSGQLARRTTASVNLRYTVFNSTTDAYRQAALSASLSQQF